MTMRPFRGFYDMQSEMNRMFDEVFGGLSRRSGRQMSSPGGRRCSTYCKRMETSSSGRSCLV
jgi:hypothetical protein